MVPCTSQEVKTGSNPISSEVLMKMICDCTERGRHEHVDISMGHPIVSGLMVVYLISFFERLNLKR
jgi:hypothetical protein